jgi:two-component system, chemotaxis family, CheB/CheR fusion protein
MMREEAERPSTLSENLMSEADGPRTGQVETGAVGLADALPVDVPRPRSVLPFHTVVIGASAGGVEALMRFFDSTPAAPGCAFIVVMHLPADRESMLSTLLGRKTAMPVTQAEQGVSLEVDKVYVAPPDLYVELDGGHLHLRAIGRRGARATGVDHCMASVAYDQGERAIGVVLTGLDSDGTIGVKAIKAEGGFTIAQLPSEAAHPDMPRNALATGLVDCELPVEEMGQAIADYVSTDAARLLTSQGSQRTDDDKDLMNVLEIVRAQLGLGFRGYKSAMLFRRINRRMNLTRTGSMARFAALLQETPEETRALAKDFLISVTEFFREPDSWSALARDVLPGLLQGKGVGDSVRVWIPGCATGEEAYSMGMVLLDCAQVQDQRLKVQIFATDIDESALEHARRGLFLPAIEKTVPPARLQKFFVKSAEGYQVRKELRDTVVFARQNVVNDPPFSRMDIVSCRNLLIYMGPELQGQLIQMFHFALEVNGVLALGKSETVGAGVPLFISASSRAHIYRRVGPARAVPIAVTPQLGRGHDEAGQPKMTATPMVDYSRLMRDALLEQRVAAAVIVDHRGNALYFYGKVHAYLLQPEGLPTTDLFSMVHEELRPQLRGAVHKAYTTRERVETSAPMHITDQGENLVRLAVSPLDTDPQSDMMIITFERTERRGEASSPTAPQDAAALRSMEDELRTTKRELRSAIEELESANEELKVANEEAMSMNEELQSANEELETSKEEVQSINEELTTVNQQLEAKVTELEVLNNDLGNLLTSTHIPTLFLDRELRIKRFTPAATTLFPLLPTDLDRPLRDISGPSDLESLLADARRVLTQLTPIDSETLSADGRQFLRRILPYRTQEDRIDGVVITYSDISELKRAGEAQRRHSAVMQTSGDAIVVHDLQGSILAWNHGAESMYGYAESEMLGADVKALLPPHARVAHSEMVERLKAGERAPGEEATRRCHDGTLLEVSVSSSLIRDDEGKPVAVALTERDISPRKQAEAKLRESEERFRTLADSAPALIWLADEYGALEFVNQEFARTCGYGADQLKGRWWIDLLHHDDAALIAAGLPGLQAGKQSRLSVNARLRVPGGEYRWMKVTLMQRAVTRQEAILSRAPGTVGTMVDIDAQVTAEVELRDASRHKDEFLAMLGHELRNPLVPIRNAAEILSTVGTDDKRVKWVRDTLVRQVEHVTRLVDDLLDISLMTRNAMRIHMQPVDLVAIIGRAIESTTSLISRKRHRFEAHLGDEPVWMEGDPIRLTQIFENLIANAAKYTNGGGTIDLQLRVEAAQAIVEVSDNGLGLDPRLAGRIFDLFVQDHRSLDRSQGGMGIGLALVRHLASLHGATVEAFSEGLNQGSRFVVRLPLLAQQPNEPDTTGETTRKASPRRILVVDDDFAGAESLAMLLDIAGHEVRFVSTATEALEVARQARPEVLLLDIGMPDVDGYELSRQLRALPEVGADAVCIAITGFGRPEDFEKSAQAGFFRHLVKPVDPSALGAVLEEARAARVERQHE